MGDTYDTAPLGARMTMFVPHAAALDSFKYIATLDLRIDYMRAAEPGKDVFAKAHCFKVTKNVAFVRAVAYDDDPEDPVAAATAAFMLDSSAGKKPGANYKPPRSQS
jgi:acyl-coenzyme A thioesterase PaaI-like protein